MKVMKKISAWFMALAVLMSMLGVTALAAEKKDEPAKKADTAVITVTNIQAGATVKAYQIVKPVFDSNDNLTGYVEVMKNTIKDVFQPTANEIGELSKKVATSPKSFNTKEMKAAGKNGTTYTAEVPAGTWLVYVTGNTVDKIYNPIIVSASYNKKGELVGKSVDAKENSKLTGGESKAKSSEVTVEKVIDHSKDKFKSGNQYGTDAAIGDDVSFVITSAIPTYGPQFDNALFWIKDTVSKGLVLNNDFVIKVDGKVLDKSNYRLSTNDTEMNFFLNFEYMKKNPGKKIEITYTAKLTEDAKTGFDLNTNTVTLTYSYNVCQSMKTIEKVNYVATFVIDGELFKVDAQKQSPKALSGAEFKLTNKDTGKIQTIETNNDGKLVFKGLDAGNYTLEETKAPAGYILDKTKHEITIRAKYKEDGKLKDYIITVDKKVFNHENNNAVYKFENAFKIPNTTISEVPELPSTGGIGTYMFTIGGAGLMALAAALFMVSRKKSLRK